LRSSSTAPCLSPPSSVSFTRLAKEAERALVDATQRLSPEERVSAFLEHCRLVMELYQAAAQRLSRWLR
jgi:hypothetical protein